MTNMDALFWICTFIVIVVPVFMGMQWLADNISEDFLDAVFRKIDKFLNL